MIVRGSLPPRSPVVAVVSKIPYSVFRIEQFSGIAHTLMAPRFGGLQVLELKDRIAELCNRATTEKDPAALNSVLSELKAALSEYIRAARRMTILHFDYFQKHQNLSPQVLPKKAEDVKEDIKKEDVKREAS